MRTLDRKYLAENPAGDEKAVISLSIPVTDAVDVPANPDGTRPRVALKATGDTYALVLAALQFLHDDEGAEVFEALLNDVVTEEEMEAFSSLAEAAPLLKERAHAISNPFRTFMWGADMTVEAAGQQTKQLVEFEMTTPSLVVGIPAITAMTKPQLLTNVAISFSPVLDDDEEYGSNEVLVVS
ncbi:hypothetical protein [Paenarthrobacter sp. YJN-5]|uniref:hypothetical protein n=1 Tax=Paenarthrobacter sp. YJN-5 TaxID=2735316 RepID=UPI001878F5D4|nr:hypothetical protein [Paenarthrobacter sp. YJN-5]QOT19625.1 hypothetical protein HMI59_23720 [Paenarthrobacter sp. YJN-5]